MLQTSLVASLAAVQTIQRDDFGVTRTPIKLDYRIDLPDGTGDGRADVLYAKQHSIAGGGNESIDLENLPTPCGQDEDAATIRALAIRVADNAPGALKVGAGGATAWTKLWTSGPSGNTLQGQTILVYPGGLFLLTAPGGGISVTGGQGTLKLTAAAGVNSLVDVIVIGSTA